MPETARTQDHETPPPVVSPEKPTSSPPTAIACLRCQLIGRRKLLCSKADACKALPHVFALGPVLLAGWAALAIAYFLATR